MAMGLIFTVADIGILVQKITNSTAATAPSNSSHWEEGLTIWVCNPMSPNDLDLSKQHGASSSSVVLVRLIAGLLQVAFGCFLIRVIFACCQQMREEDE